MGSWFVVVFGAVFAVVGLFLEWQWLGKYQLARQSAAWPSATARIEKAWVEVRHGKSNTYRVHVRYGYSVDGLSHEGTVVNPMYDNSQNQRSAQELVDALAPGSMVGIRYDSANPSRSTLLAGTLSSQMLGGLLPLAFLGMGGLFVLISLIQMGAAHELLFRLVRY